MVSNCCWAPVNDPWNTGEWLCRECFEHCTDEPEKEEIPLTPTQSIDRQIEMFKDMIKQFSFKI